VTLSATKWNWKVPYVVLRVTADALQVVFVHERNNAAKHLLSLVRLQTVDAVSDEGLLGFTSESRFAHALKQ